MEELSLVSGHAYILLVAHADLASLWVSMFCSFVPKAPGTPGGELSGGQDLNSPSRLSRATPEGRTEGPLLQVQLK